MVRSWTKRRTTGLFTAAVLVLTAAVTPSAAAASPPTAPRAATGSQVLVDPAVDLGTHAPGPEISWNDSIYIASMVKARGHEFGLLVHTLTLPNVGDNVLAFAVTDKTTGWYKTFQTVIAPEDYHWSRGRLDIRAPGLRWTGNARGMAVSVTTPWGTLDVQHVRTGPVMYYRGTGQIPLLDVKNFEFGFPTMRTVGKLVIDGRRYPITGESWMDRQWGPLPASLSTWSWMNLNLPNGDKIAVWNPVGGGVDDPWAMLLRRDGSYQVVEDVEPLAASAAQPWTSPASGNTYPTRWRVRIPELNAQFDVRVTGTPGQELTPVGRVIISRLEATAKFTGTYRGRHVEGENFVELVGPGWHA
jgi:lipocalin-like protein/hydroxyneurosporene synthase CrtC